MDKKNRSERPAALVTGGSRGIGRAVCLELARNGYDLCVNYASRAEAAEETARLCREAAPDCSVICVAADVSREEECERLVNACTERFGRLDVLVNNAGITLDGRVKNMTGERFRKVIETNLDSAFYCSRFACAVMEQGGRIVNVSSLSGLHGTFGQANYAAAKAGLIGLTKCLAREFAGKGIRVNAVAPGVILTEMTAAIQDNIREGMIGRIPLGRIGLPEDVAGVIGFLVSDKSAFITGQVLVVDGGMHM